MSELTEQLKRLIEADPDMADVWVEGEVSNCRPAASGHWYFTLKDDRAALSCVIWKGQASGMLDLPEDGGSFLLHGAVTIYPSQGRHQLYVDHCERAGVGDLHRAFERLKAQLEAEGLFDTARKRPLPGFPARIGIVTSPQAAALRDICQVIRRRWPSAELLLAPTLVQGEGAPAGIVAALAAIERAGVELVILARGGGSLEDLWAFNDEAVARAIAACGVPVVAGIGHETDFSIADFVADLRAPTPSAAAELVTPDARELRQAVDEARARLAAQAGRRVALSREGLERLAQRLALASPGRAIREAGLRTAERRGRLARATEGRLRLCRADLEGRRRRLRALGPAATLARGYAHVSRRRDGRTVRAPREVRAGEGLIIRLAEGAIDAVATGQGRLFDMEEPT